MNTLFVYDKPMCCSTGVCGPDVDMHVARFAADLEWLKSQGRTVQRYNLAQEPNRFVENSSVKQVLDRAGEKGLPVILVNHQVVSEGIYPTRDQLVGWLEVEAKETPLPVSQDLPVIGSWSSPIFNERLVPKQSSEATSSCCGGGARDGCC